MQSIENRIANLEAKASAADGVMFVWREKGETEADALKRAGYTPEDIANGKVLIFSWLDVQI
jgi:hypothetical protein